MRKITLFVMAAWLLTLITGCHKEKFFADDSDLLADLEAIRSQLTPVEQKFFDYHYAEQHNPYVKPGGLVTFRDGEDEAFMQSLIDKVLIDNSVHRFAPAVIDHVGYPAWSRSMILRDETQTHRVAVVPFFKTNDTLTRAFLLAAKPSNNQWVFRLAEKGFVLNHLNREDTTAVAIREKAFCMMNLRALDKKLFHNQDLQMLQWIWQHRDVLTGSVENANVLDFRCTWLLFVPIVECISNNYNAAFTPEGGEIETRWRECPPGTRPVVTGWALATDGCNGGGILGDISYAPGGSNSGRRWFDMGVTGPSGASQSFSGHTDLQSLISLCNQIALAQSGEMPRESGFTYTETEASQCDKLNRIMNKVFVTPDDLAWLIHQNPSAFEAIANFLNNNLSSLQLEAVAAYIRLLRQGRVQMPLYRFAELYQLVYGQLASALGLNGQEAEFVLSSGDGALAFEIKQFMGKHEDGEQVLKILFQGLREGHFTTDDLGGIIDNMDVVHGKKSWDDLGANRLETINQIENIRQYLSRRKTDYGEAAQYLGNLLPHLIHHEEFSNEEVYRVYELAYEWYSHCVYNTVSSIVRNVIKAVRPFIEMALIETGFHILGNIFIVRPQASYRITSELPTTVKSSSATVWSRISPSAPHIPNTTIPNTFTFTAQNGQKFHVQFSATEHLGELVTKNGAAAQPWFQAQKGLRSQLVLDDFARAVDEIVTTHGTIIPNRVYSVGKWQEIIFGGVAPFSNGNLRIFHIKAW